MERGKGDFSRFTFDPTKHYTRVLQQEGRASLDSDAYEYAEILEHFDRATRNDVIGLCGVPENFNNGLSFKILYDPAKQDLTIKAGRIYVDGLLCELENDVDYLSQPDLFNPPALGKKPGKTDLIYLDVWQRQITAIEDPNIREVALDGPDTSTRLKTVWQVKVKEIKVDGGKDVTCDNVGNWQPLTSGGKLSTLAAPTPPPDPCHISAATGFRGIDNHLYRVEIHSVDQKGVAKFKWSRENGSVVFAIDSFLGDQKHATQLKLKQIGHDDALSLPVGAWVEILDDATVDTGMDTGMGGVMAKIAAPFEESDLILTLDRSIDVTVYDTKRSPRVRRWDQVQNVDKDGLITVDTDQTHPFMQLEDGVTIHFYGSNFLQGDYWAFEARTITGTVKQLDQAPPQGIEHHYCCLAIVKWPNAGGPVPVPSDCRNTFPPLITQKPAPTTDWPRVVKISWINDVLLPLEDFFAKGLWVTFSEAMDPATATLDTFIVVLELPDPQLELLWLSQILKASGNEFAPMATDMFSSYQPPFQISNLGLLGHRPFIVYGTVTSMPTDPATWQFTPKTIVDGDKGTMLGVDVLLEWLAMERIMFQNLKPPPPLQIRCRVTLKGNAIYAQKLDGDGLIRPLDGDTIALSTPLPAGLKSPAMSNVVLPSGDGIRGGDFESWFYLGQPDTLSTTVMYPQKQPPQGVVVLAKQPQPKGPSAKIKGVVKRKIISK